MGPKFFRVGTLQFQIIGGVLIKREGPTDNLNINKRGGGGGEDPNKRRGDLKNVIGQKWQPVITNYGCPKQNFLAPCLDIVDTGATITSNKIRKANQSNFTITKSWNIEIYVFETSLIQL